MDAEIPKEEPAKEVDELAYRIIGAAIEVHRELGPGYLEGIYEAALAKELEVRHLSFQRQHPVAVLYKGDPVGETRLDLLVEGKVIVELKAIDALGGLQTAQVISYLKATGLSLRSWRLGGSIRIFA